MSVLRVGVVILPDERWGAARRTWIRAEELGFDHAWTYDHLTWGGHRDRPWFAAVPTLTAAAIATSSIGLGLLVGSPNFRHPLPFAKELITLDDISGGRAIAGIGAGSEGWDATMLGEAALSRSDRADRFAEFVELVDTLLREPRVSSVGRYFSASEARTYPGCVQQPRLPLAIAATGPRGMDLAACHGDMWVTTGARDKAPGVAPEVGARDVQLQVEQLEHACARNDRRPEDLRRVVVLGPVLDSGLDSPDAFAEVVDRYEGAGATDLVVHWPRASEPYRADVDVFERIFSNRISSVDP